MTEIGYAAQVVKVLEDHSYQLDEEELKSVLLRDQIKDLPVVVVSVAGAFRRGKSFMLNFFLRYLTSPPSSRLDGSWIGEDSEPLVGFSWSGGTHRNTTGILLWSEPLTVTLPSGEKVAVLLMDTQGTFDSESTVRDCSTIFALSTLLSSVQIYNLMTQIQEDDLQHLQLFTEYGKMVRDQEGSKAFQVLEFLIRDWANSDEYAYGSTGGELFLREKLKINPKMPQEMKDLRTHITSCFEKVSCFLMPHPGLKVTRKSFKGKISEIDPEFITHLKDFVLSLFGPEKLMPKRINGELIRTKDLFTYIKTYMTIFNSDKVPTTHSMLEATVEAGMLTAMNEARAVYEDGMDAECGLKQPSVPAYDLQDLHQKYLAKARAVFTGMKKMGSIQEANSYLETLTRNIVDSYVNLKSINKSKNKVAMQAGVSAYNSYMSAAWDARAACLHPADLDIEHVNGKCRALVSYRPNKTCEDGFDYDDSDEQTLLNIVNQRYEELKRVNDSANQAAVQQAFNMYCSVMDDLCRPTLWWLFIIPILMYLTKKAEYHNIAVAKALDVFHSKRRYSHSRHFGDTYLDKLKSLMQQAFAKY